MKRSITIILSFILIIAFVIPASAFSTIAVKGIKLDKSKITLNVGKTYKLKVALTPKNTTQKKLTYVTANKKIATVDANGTIKGAGKGTTTITVYTYNKKISAKCNVTVTQPAAKVNEGPITLKMFVRERWAGVGYDNLVNKTIQEKTNTKWNLVVVPAAELKNKLNIMLSGGDRFDIMNIPGDETELSFVKEGLLLPINKYFDKAPNLYERNKMTWDSMRYSDGNIYTLNACLTASLVESIPYYRKDWLDKFGLGIPKTIEEYLVVADKFSNGDPDGNGKKDTYAFGAVRGLADERFFDHIFSAYGVLPFYWLEENGTLFNGAVHPVMKEALSTLNKLYKMGAIDPEFITDNTDRHKSKFLTGIYGAPCWAYSVLDTNNYQNSYAPFHEKNPNAVLVPGVLMSSSFKSSSNKVGMRCISARGWVRTAIGSQTKKIDAVMRLLDYYNSEEGMTLLNYGVEGKHYTKENGDIKVTATGDDIKKDGITQLYLTMHFMNYQTTKAFRDIQAFASSIGTQNAADGIQIDENVKYQTDLYDNAKSQYMSIITGEVSVDKGFEKIQEEWKKRGGDEWAKALNKAYKERK